MKNKLVILVFGIIFLSALLQFSWKSEEYISFVVNPKNQNISFYLKNDEGVNFGSLENLKFWLNKNHKELLLATNGGMYKKDHSPQGLYIEKNVIKSSIDTLSGNGNFYLKPNGIFYLTNDNKAIISKTEDFKYSSTVKYATQSGPMLVIDGKIHKTFNKASANLNIRSGVGVLPNNDIIFAISKKEVNFYEFAEFFKNKGCINALYLDGFVSKMYCPEANSNQLDGDFGVIIAVTKEK